MSGRARSTRGGEKQAVPEAEFTSYYGRPVLKQPVWRAPDVPGYFFLGGLAGASSALALGAQLAGYQELARAAKITAAGAIGLSAAALVHDLGRPARFLNMLRVFKPTSPMSVGSWLLGAYAPAAAAAAASAVTGRLPSAGLAATAGAAALGPAVATYTAVLICDTAVPAWHDAHSYMPYLFAGSSAAAAGGLGLLAVPPGRAVPATGLAVVGAAAELTAGHLLIRRLGAAAEPYQAGTAGALMRAGKILTACGLAAALASGGRHRGVAALSGTALLAASAVTRFGIFEAGRASAADPKYTVLPQRERISERGGSGGAAAEKLGRNGRRYHGRWQRHAGRAAEWTSTR
jgi:formate-dependent nitrite reductase membrane component NrfD